MTSGIDNIEVQERDLDVDIMERCCAQRQPCRITACQHQPCGTAFNQRAAYGNTDITGSTEYQHASNSNCAHGQLTLPS